MKYRLALLALQVVGVSLTFAQYKPKDGCVPDADTAIEIAVAVWSPIYGADHIAGEKPYHATLKEGVWIIEGSLPEGYNRGVARAEIAKEDGKILLVSHGK